MHQLAYVCCPNWSPIWFYFVNRWYMGKYNGSPFLQQLTAFSTCIKKLLKCVYTYTNKWRKVLLQQLDIAWMHQERHYARAQLSARLCMPLTLSSNDKTKMMSRCVQAAIATPALRACDVRSLIEHRHVTPLGKHCHWSLEHCLHYHALHQLFHQCICSWFCGPSKWTWIMLCSWLLYDGQLLTNTPT